MLPSPSSTTVILYFYFTVLENVCLYSNYHLVCLSMECLKKIKGKFFFSGVVTKVGGKLFL